MNEKIKVVLPTGTNEVTIREGKAPELLPIKAPVRVNISGTIGSVYEFLSKRFDQADQIDEKRCHIIVNREEISIQLITAEHKEYKSGAVTGQLEFHPKYEEFGINQGKNWLPNDLGQFFKMNRAFFPDRGKNMELVAALKNFKASVDAKIEKQKSESGTFADNYSAVVQSNLPGEFSLSVPIFKGIKAESIEIEFYASVSGREVFLQMYSPGARELTENLRDTVIDAELAKIRELTPNIAIIEE